MKTVFVAYFLSVSCLIALPTAASGSTLYGIGGPLSGSRLYSVDQSTAVGTPIGPSISGRQTVNLASDWRAESFRLWTIDTTILSQLIRIDPTTGVQTVIGSMGNSIASIAFDVITGQLYGSNGPTLYRIDTASAALTTIGPTGQTQVRALGFDRSGNLFGVNGTSLLGIDTSTGTATNIGTTGLQPLNDLAVRPEDGVMFAEVGGLTTTLYQIDPATGQSTFVAGPNLNYAVNGLAFGPAVPEPSALVLAIAAFAALPVRSRKSVPTIADNIALC